jgi:hypothetical protein
MGSPNHIISFLLPTGTPVGIECKSTNRVKFCMHSGTGDPPEEREWFIFEICNSGNFKSVDVHHLQS